MKAFYKMIVAAVAVGVFVNAYSKVILPSFYADNMVLQQKALMTVKGKAIPNSTVKFKASWDNKTILAKADAQMCIRDRFDTSIILLPSIITEPPLIQPCGVSILPLSICVNILFVDA